MMVKELSESEKVQALTRLGGFEIVKGFLFDTPKAEDYFQQFISSEEVFDALREGERQFFMNDDGEVQPFEEAWEYWYDCYCETFEEEEDDEYINDCLRTELEKKLEKESSDWTLGGEIEREISTTNEVLKPTKLVDMPEDENDS